MNPASDLAAETDDPGIRHAPTPEQIRAECAVIRSEWTPAEEFRRRAIPACRELDYGRRATLALDGQNDAISDGL